MPMPPSSFMRLTLLVIARVNRWYGSNTSGYNTADRDVLHTDGSSLCRLRARLTEKLVFGSALFSGLGVGLKIWTLAEGVAAVVLAPLGALLWSRYLYALECRVISALPPVPTAAGKFGALVARLALAGVFAVIQAVPIVWVGLTGAARLEAMHMQLAEAERTRDQVVRAQGLPDLAVQGELLSTDLKMAAGAVERLPATVTDIQAAVTACEDKLEAVRKSGALRIAAAEARMRALAITIMSPKSPAAQREAAEARHAGLKMDIERTRAAIRQAEAECADRARVYVQSRDEYRKAASARRDLAQTELDRHRRVVREREEQAVADIKQLRERTTHVMQNDEGLLFQAAWKVLNEQAWARGLALVVVIAFLAVDMAAIATKAMGSPGPYEYALAARHAVAAAASRRRIEQAKREAEGDAKFHAQDQGAVFARRIAREHELEDRAARAQHDIEMVRRRVRAITDLAGDLEALDLRTRGTPGLRQLIEDLLRDMRGPAAAARA